MPRFHGDDTFTKVTILDEDFPGTLRFEETAITIAGGRMDYVELRLQRVQGSDGKISCIVRTDKISTTSGLNVKNAVEYEDYIPLHEKVNFAHGENEKTIKIQLVEMKAIKDATK